MVGAVAGLYYGAGRAGLHLAYLHGTVAALWPPVGVGIAALVILGPGIWPGIVIGDLLLADFSTPWETIVGQTVGNTLEVVVAAVLFRRLTQKRIALERVWDVLALVACAALGTLISAVFGVVSLRLGDVIKADEFGSVFRTWWLGDFHRRARVRAAHPRLGGAQNVADAAHAVRRGRASPHRPDRV